MTPGGVNDREGTPGSTIKPPKYKSTPQNDELTRNQEALTPDRGKSPKRRTRKSRRGTPGDESQTPSKPQKRRKNKRSATPAGETTPADFKATSITP